MTSELIADKYEVLEVIGRGGMGTVYKAMQRNLERIVAIKMLSEDLASDPEFRARFRQEATLVARLHHPNIVQVYDIEPHGDTFCIIMEYLEGESLQDRLNRDGAIPEHEAAHIGVQVARALQHAHTHQIVHRDVKPDNIRIMPDGTAKVMDFGIARFVDSKMKTQTGVSMGTPKFMSPEQVTGKGVDWSTDLYSLGVCLYYCLAGRVPFDGPNPISIATRHLYEPPEPPSSINPLISPGMERVVLTAISKEKSERYADGDEMADALLATQERSPIVIGDPMLVAPGDVTQKIILPVTMPLPGTPPPAPTPAPTPDIDFPSPREIEDAAEASAADSIPATLGAGFWNRRKWVLTTSVAVVMTIGTIGVVSRGGGNKPISAAATPSAVSVEVRANESVLQAEFARADRLADEHRFAQSVKCLTQLQENTSSPKLTDHDIQLIQEKLRRIDQMWASLPVTESRLLAERRQNKGLEFQNPPLSYALATAYLEAAKELDSAQTDLATLPLLQRKVDELTSQTTGRRTEASASAIRQADAVLHANPSDPKAESILIQTITDDPGCMAAWVKLAGYYRTNGFADDARVLYRYVALRATTASPERELAARELSALRSGPA